METQDPQKGVKVLTTKRSPRSCRVFPDRLRDQQQSGHNTGITLKSMGKSIYIDSMTQKSMPPTDRWGARDPAQPGLERTKSIQLTSIR